MMLFTVGFTMLVPKFPGIRILEAGFLLPWAYRGA